MTPHRPDFEPADLPEGYRPLASREKVHIGDEINYCGEWHPSNQDDYHVLSLHLKHRTTRMYQEQNPLPVDAEVNAALERIPDMTDRHSFQVMTQTARVSFLANLRAIVGKRCPVNKAGHPIVSDFDLITCSNEEFLAATKDL